MSQLWFLNRLQWNNILIQTSRFLYIVYEALAYCSFMLTNVHLNKNNGGANSNDEILNRLQMDLKKSHFLH